MSQNARLIQKNILEDVGPALPGETIINCFGPEGNAEKLSILFVYDVQTPGAKTFDALGYASLVIADLTYTAVESGPSGNDITIAYIGGSGPITIDVTGTDIVIHIDSDENPPTANAILAAVQADEDASALVNVEVTGTGSNTQNPHAEAPLTGGQDSEINLDDDTVTIPSHGFSTGFKVRLTTTGTLPAPLLTATDYFIIVIDDNTIQFAATVDDAIAGIPIDLTDEGSNAAVDTVTGVALSGANFKIYKSNNGTDWGLVETQNITVDGKTFFEDTVISYGFLKVTKSITAGVVDLAAYTLVVGEEN